MDDVTPDAGPAPEPSSVSAPEPATQPPVVTPVVVPATVVPSLPIAVPPPPLLDGPVLADRGTWLVVFGVAQIILGLLAGLMIPLIALGAFMSQLVPGAHMRPGQLVTGAVPYAFIAVSLIALGIGSVQMKRWARALTLVTSWYWLVMGILITILMTAVLPVVMKGALEQMKQTGSSDAPSPEMSTAVMAVMLTVIIIFIAFFLIAVPLAYVILYSRDDVADTCRRRDPVERWTDRTPLPVLGASVVLMVGAGYALLTAVSSPLFPFFGRYLTGFPAAGCLILTCALDVYLAIAFFRRQPLGWWIEAVALPLHALSLTITYLRADMFQALAKTGLSDQQLQAMSSNPMLRSHIFLWWNLISMVLFIGYLLWLKRYFRTPKTTAVSAVPAEIG